MVTLLRTDSKNKDFIALVQMLDIYLSGTDGDLHSFYHQYNSIESIKHTVVAHENGNAIGCGALKEYGPGIAEVKRMYTLPAARGKGIATMILSELEMWASEMSFKKCILETGKGQPEAIKLYHKNGYRIVPNYGQYAAVENSLCFEKQLK